MSIGTQLKEPIWVRFADKVKEPVYEWLQANKSRNAFDANVLNYPATKILAAHNNGTTYVYLPIQQVAILESVGPNPGATVQQLAASMVELVKATATLASGAGMGEMMFLASDENTARGAELMGFEELPYKVYRKRLG